MISGLIRKMPILPYAYINASGEQKITELRPTNEKIKLYSHDHPEFSEEVVDLLFRSKVKNKGVYTSWKRYGPWEGSSIDDSIKDDSVFVCWGYEKGKAKHETPYLFHGKKVQLYNDIVLIRLKSTMELKDTLLISASHIKKWIEKVSLNESDDSPNVTLSIQPVSKGKKEKTSKKKNAKKPKKSLTTPSKKESLDEKKQNKNKIMNDLLETIDSEESEEESVEDLLNHIKKPNVNQVEDDDDGMYFDEEESDEELGGSNSSSKKAKRLAKLKAAAVAAKKANSDDISDNENSESENESDDDELEEEEDEIEEEQSASIVIADDLECDEELETMFDTKEGLLEFEEYDYGKSGVKWELPVVHSIWAM